jgi:AraC family transcriptional regulator of adaptative response/methylated-DNA-[protein]-cysteine methyltransferase
MTTPAILYTIRATSLGRLLVAATPRGVCHVRFGEAEAELASALAAEFRFAPIARDDAQLAAWAGALADCVEGRPGAPMPPLDVSGSRFQRRVWDALRTIPAGATRSYGEVAAAIGRPGAARAVARACATNPVPVAVPCHRVVPRGGGTGGYRYGTWRKRHLLARESTGARGEAAAGPSGPGREPAPGPAPRGARAARPDLRGAPAPAAPAGRR